MCKVQLCNVIQLLLHAAFFQQAPARTTDIASSPGHSQILSRSRGEQYNSQLLTYNRKYMQHATVVVYLRSGASSIITIHNLRGVILCAVSSSLPGQSVTPTMPSLLMTKIVHASVPRYTSKSSPKFPTRLTS